MSRKSGLPGPLFGGSKYIVTGHLKSQVCMCVEAWFCQIWSQIVNLQA